MLVSEAMKKGATQEKACRETGVSARTYRRWRDQGADRRPTAVRPKPANALTEEERAEIIRVANNPENASKTPAEIVVDLADGGTYLASESSFYRVLDAHRQKVRRGRARAPKAKAAAVTHLAVAPRQVWVWDITWLPSKVAGIFFKLYIIMDLYSRKIIAWEVWEEENAAHSEQLLRRAALAENIAVNTVKVVLHGDNGSPLRAGTVLALMYSLGITPSHSRPRVSNDNAHAEALFRTAKYHPTMLPAGFDSLESARQWAASFVQWYNHVHKHKSLNFVTPHHKHIGVDGALLAKRDQLYQKCRDKNPRRWIKGNTRDWTPVLSTALNPPDNRTIEKNIKKSA
jgi:putative transposase